MVVWLCGLWSSDGLTRRAVCVRFQYRLVHIRAYWLHICSVILDLCPSPTRESTSRQNKMGIDERWQFWTLCTTKANDGTGGGGGRARLTTACPESDVSRSLLSVELVSRKRRVSAGIRLYRELFTQHSSCGNCFPFFFLPVYHKTYQEQTVPGLTFAYHCWCLRTILSPLTVGATVLACAGIPILRGYGVVGREDTLLLLQ